MYRYYRDVTKHYVPKTSGSKKNSNLEPENVTLSAYLPTAPKGGLSAAIRKGLGSLDSYLYLTPYSIINELA